MLTVQATTVNWKGRGVLSLSMRSLIQIKTIFWKYFQVHVKLHEIHAAELDPVPEWRKWNAFVKVIMSIQLQDEYRGIKDDAR